jgi:hypothetical protein
MFIFGEDFMKKSLLAYCFEPMLCEDIWFAVLNLRVQVPVLGT